MTQLEKLYIIYFDTRVAVRNIEVTNSIDYAKSRVLELNKNLQDFTSSYDYMEVPFYEF